MEWTLMIVYSALQENTVMVKDYPRFQVIAVKDTIV